MGEVATVSLRIGRASRSCTSPVDAFRQEPYGALKRAFRRLIVFDGADHAVFGGRTRGAAESSDPMIQGEAIRITFALLDHFLREEPAAQRLKRLCAASHLP